MSDFWQDDSEEEFRDIPEEVAGQEAPPAQVKHARPTAAQQAQLANATKQQAAPQAPVQNTEYVSEDAQEEQEEEDFSTVLSDARLRLEQGRLYEMIMNNDLFDGTEADQKAVKHVQRQIRNFAKEQMEIMLGMRQEPSQQQALLAENFPFNDLEVEALKALASAATKGATQAPEAQQFSGAQAQPARQGLKPINLKAPTQRRPMAEISKDIAANRNRPLPSAPQKPVARKKNDAVVEQILAEEGVSREELETVFPPNYNPITKPLHQLTEQEMLERNRQAKQRVGTQVKSAGALPMPTPEQEEMLHTQRAQTAANHPQMQTIMNLLTNQPKKK